MTTFKSCDGDDHKRALIGSLLLLPVATSQIACHVCAADFFDEQFGKFYALIVDHHEPGLKIDPVILLEPSRQIFGQTAAATWAELFSSVPHAAHIEYYAEGVLKASKRRKLLTIADDLKKRTSRATDPKLEAANAIRNLDWVGQTGDSLELTTAYDAGAEIIARLDDNASRRHVSPESI